MCHYKPYWVVQLAHTLYFRLVGYVSHEFSHIYTYLVMKRMSIACEYKAFPVLLMVGNMQLSVDTNKLYPLSNQRTRCDLMRRCWSSSCCRRFAISSTPTVRGINMRRSFAILPLGFSSLSAAITSMQSSAVFPPGECGGPQHSGRVLALCTRDPRLSPPHL